mmetsp:Transcript_23641/g.60398  ORF Transcript_23641/g.60398 Transcript_23641/m.60398 type:complete len:280 (-) Transcript_23641:1953-2792(-)
MHAHGVATCPWHMTCPWQVPSPCAAGPVHLLYLIHHPPFHAKASYLATCNAQTNVTEPPSLDTCNTTGRHRATTRCKFRSRHNIPITSQKYVQTSVGHPLDRQAPVQRCILCSACSCDCCALPQTRLSRRAPHGDDTHIHFERGGEAAQDHDGPAHQVQRPREGVERRTLHHVTATKVVLQLALGVKHEVHHAQASLRVHLLPLLALGTKPRPWLGLCLASTSTRALRRARRGRQRPKSDAQWLRSAQHHARVCLVQREVQRAQRAALLCSQRLALAVV